MTIQHTPGPWFSCRNLVRAESHRTGRRIAETNVQNLPSHHEQPKEREAINAANARLIAAAPELLEALQAIIPPVGYNPDWWCPQCRALKHGSNVTNSEHCEDCGTFLGNKQPGDEWIEKGRTAIAKALGQNT